MWLQELWSGNMYNNQYPEYTSHLSAIHALVSLSRQADDERAIQRCFNAVPCVEDPLLSVNYPTLKQWGFLVHTLNFCSQVPRLFLAFRKCYVPIKF